MKSAGRVWTGSFYGCCHHCYYCLKLFLFHKWWERGGVFPGPEGTLRGSGVSFPSPAVLPPAHGSRHSLTRSVGHDAHQALHRLEQLALLALQEAGIAAGGSQAALQAGEGAVLAAQQAPQPLLLAAEAGQLRLLLRLQGLHPRLQGAAGGGALGEAAVPTVQSRSLAFPWVPWGLCVTDRRWAQRGGAACSGLHSSEVRAQQCLRVRKGRERDLALE